MSTFVYNGSVAEATGLNRNPSIDLSGGGTAEGIILGVTARLTFSTTASANTYPVTATLYFAGGSKSVTQSVKMTASNATGAQFIFTFSDLTVDEVNSISSVSVSCSSNSGKIFIKGTQYVSVEYLVVSSCTSPTTVEVEDSSAAPGGKVTLRWSGAEAGDNNAITGYQIYRATATNDYSLLATVGSTATSGSTTVVAPTTNGQTYYYKVQTVGTWDGYSSGRSTAYAALSCNFASVRAPSGLKIDITNVAPGAEATLSWSDAAAGENNAITGYEVHRATSVDGPYTELLSVDSTSTAGECSVVAPTTSGVTYYYKVRTRGTLAGCDSELSNTSASLTCTYSSPGAPTQVAIENGLEVYAEPGADLVLTWSGATDGANNPITGYRILRDGAVYADLDGATVSSYVVPAHETAGGMRSYSVRAIGMHSLGAVSATCTVYSYTDPVAPSSVTVSEENPSAGSLVKLSWSGASEGSFNAIVGYRVYRSTTVNGEGALVASVVSTATSGSRYVDAPAREGDVYYYRVETVGAYCGSGLSTAYASVTAGESTSVAGEIEVEITPRKPREKRGFILGDYDTAAHGWTLAPGWRFPEPETQTNYIEVPGRSTGPLDFSTVLSGGDPRYGSRQLEATFECSEGTRLDREDLISHMTNLLHGQKVQIIFPDDRTRYAVGRISVEKDYNDPAHAAIKVKATCEPWRYSKQEKQIELLADQTSRAAVLTNSGRKEIVPELTVSGRNARVWVQYGTVISMLEEGTHVMDHLILRSGNTLITYGGTAGSSGTLIIKYREAIL